MVEQSEQIQRAKDSLIDLVFDNNSAKIAQICNAGISVNEGLNKHEQTVLHLAVQVGRPQIVDMLFEQFATRLDINAQDIAGRGALHYACRQGDLDMMKKILTFEGLNCELRTHGGETPLMHACQSGQIYVVGEALNNNFNPFQKNGLMQTARDQASMFKEEVCGRDMLALLDTAIEQWTSQVSQEQIDSICQDPEKYFYDFMPPNINVNNK